MNLVKITLLIAAVSGRALLVAAGEAFYSLTGTKSDGSSFSMEDFRGKVGECCVYLSSKLFAKYPVRFVSFG